MIDLISKQAAINTTYNMCCRWDGEDRDDLRNMMLTAFQELPTIDPVKHGKWECVKKKLARGGYVDASECSVCHKIIMPHLKPNYCPNCGARMERSE